MGLAKEAAEVNGRDYLPYNKLYHYNDYELIYYINDVTIANEEVLVEYGANGTATGTYEYGNERLSVEYANHAKEYYLYNGTGNVVQTTTQNSSVFLRYTYDAFGNITSIRAPFAVDTDDINRYTFNGETMTIPLACSIFVHVTTIPVQVDLSRRILILAIC